jgi:hypothetical protein
VDRAFGIIFSLHRGTPMHEQWVVECLKGSWPKLVGEKLASVCRPVYLANAVLKVEILDAAWKDTVRNMRLELQQRLSDETGGEVRAIKLVSD